MPLYGDDIDGGETKEVFEGSPRDAAAARLLRRFSDNLRRDFHR